MILLGKTFQCGRGAFQIELDPMGYSVGLRQFQEIILSPGIDVVGENSGVRTSHCKPDRIVPFGHPNVYDYIVASSCQQVLKSPMKFLLVCAQELRVIRRTYVNISRIAKPFEWSFENFTRFQIRLLESLDSQLAFPLVIPMQTTREQTKSRDNRIRVRVIINIL